jgi:hypothetical protein
MEPMDQTYSIEHLPAKHAGKIRDLDEKVPVKAELRLGLLQLAIEYPYAPGYMPFSSHAWSSPTGTLLQAN